MFPGLKFCLDYKRIIHSIFIVFLLMLVACGGETAPEAPAEPPASITPTIEQPSVSRQGVLRVAMQPIVNIDPIAISSDSEVLVANHVYDYLVDIDPQSNPIPRLATGWTVSEDGRSYTFTLAEGVFWHDGSPFSAADVVWTFDRLRNTSGTPTADLYSNVTKVEATDELKVTFILNNPNPFFLYDLSDNHALILKTGTADASSGFNGTGPFKVASYSPEDRIVMEANDAYFIAGMPRLAGLEIIFFNEDTAAVDALRGGQIDLAMRMSSSLFETLKSEPGIVAVDVPTNGFDLVRLRADRAPGNDPRVIQALRLATDRQAIFNVVQQGYGAIGNDSPIGPLYAAYHDPGAQSPARDVAAARALLAAAGFDASSPLRLTLHTPDTGNRPDLAVVLKQQWEEAGAQITVSVEPESVYYGDDGWLEVDLGITGWGSRPYPQFYLDVMLVTGAQWNEAHFSDAEFDALARTAGTTLDEQERVVAYQNIQKLLVERGPAIIPYYFAQFGAIRDQFTGFALKAFAGRTDFRNVTFVGP